jgi:hypothetical protein
MRWFGSKKGATVAPEPQTALTDAEETEGQLRVRLTQKEIELYPLAVKLLWHYYDARDNGKEAGSPKEFPGPIDETVNDSVWELEKVGLLEVIPTFSDFSITAKLTRLGLQVMARQSGTGHLEPVSIPDPGTGELTVYKEVNLG